MIPTFFDSPERLAKLREAKAALVGTPFFANSEAPGPAGGIDCVHTLNFLFRYSGAITQIDIPRQKMDYGEHGDRSLLIEAFDTWPELKNRFACVWKRTTEPEADALEAVRADLLPGDALCMLAGKVPHHGGAMTDAGEFIHALRRDGVHTMRLDAVLRGWRVLGYLAAVYRPLPRC